MNALWDVKNEGFILLYGLFVFQIVSLYTVYIVGVIQLNVAVSNLDLSLQKIELNTIKKVITDLHDYKEEDETYTIENYDIELIYEGIQCIITISKQGKVLIKSELIYDDIDLFVNSYTYMNDYH